MGGNSNWEIGDILEVNNNKGKHDTWTVEGDFSSFENWCKQRAILGSKRELIKEDFTKSDLRECDVIVFRNGERRVYFDDAFLSRYNADKRMEYCGDNLVRNDETNEYDVMKVYRNGELIFNRVEKSPIQIEIESIEEEQRKLADRLSELRKGL